MTLRKYCVIALVVIMAMMLPMASSIPVAAELASGGANITPGLHTGWMTENYTTTGNNGTSNITTWTSNRTFEYYIPDSYNNNTAVPLLFSFCGLGSSGEGQRDLTKFDQLAEQEGCIAVFPDATNLDPTDPRWSYYNTSLPALNGSNIMWNCGEIEGIPIAPLQWGAGVDDAGFVADMIDWFEANCAINASEIYATGMSNGAMFSYYLAFNLTGVFAGIAPVTGPMDLNLGWNATTNSTPMTVITVRSPTDPIIPEYGGCGLICNNYGYPTNDTIAYWCGVDNITAPPEVTTWGPTDNITTYRYVYSGGTNGTKVILFWEVGGQWSDVYGKELYIGHTWPGGPQYTPPSLIGLVDNEIDGSAQIWKYLPPLKYCLTIHSSSILGSVTTSGYNKFTTVSDPQTGVNIATTTLFFAADNGTHVVNLTATPNSSRFVNWTGNVSTIGNATAATTTITISQNTDYEITANFVGRHDLTISSTSGGSVTVPGTGTHTYDAGTVVPLTATPASGYSFVSWTGNGTVASSHSASTTITMNDDYSITANFASTGGGGGGCFIATAAYGTPTAPQLVVLRAFRDDVLLKSTVGSRLVSLYYKVSPPIANFISQHNFVRTLVRELLVDPIVWLAKATEGRWWN